jgi:putative nucleotidyltransferase with HDIG domain
MNRSEAYDLVHSRLGDGATFAHCLAAEACMRALAVHFGQDPEIWGLAGLTHDLDLDECANDMERHAALGGALLEEAGAPPEVVHAVLGHNDKVERVSLLDLALWCVDPTTGFIVASALVRPSKSTSDLTIKSLKNRMKEKRFAAAVNRDQIRACAEIGLELDDFLTLCLSAMDAIRTSLGLEGIAQ